MLYGVGVGACQIVFALALIRVFIGLLAAVHYK